jgi:hypothetical protein
VTKPARTRIKMRLQARALMGRTNLRKNDSGWSLSAV